MRRILSPNGRGVSRLGRWQTGLLLLAGCVALSAAVRSGVSHSTDLTPRYGWLYSVYWLGRDHFTSCQARQYRDFDFWLGRWAVTTREGAPSGRSEVTSDVDGCAVMEFFAGGQGRSLSAYDRSTGRWNQDYVDHQGLTLRLQGRLADGAMRMEDSVRTIPNGPSLKSRFAWSADTAANGVRQTWWFSTDGGTTEQVNFDGLYRADPGYVAGQPPPDVVCRERPAYRALDALLGTWRVSFMGDEVGTATLVATTGGCLIEETFTDTRTTRPGGAYRLKALLYYDRYINSWYRVQTDTYGEFHRLGGSVIDGGLRAAGVIPGSDAKPVNGTLDWRPVGSDTLLQVWSVKAAPVPTIPAYQFPLVWVRIRTP